MQQAAIARCVAGSKHRGGGVVAGPRRGGSSEGIEQQERCRSGLGAAKEARQETERTGIALEPGGAAYLLRIGGISSAGTTV